MIVGPVSRCAFSSSRPGLPIVLCNSAESPRHCLLFYKWVLVNKDAQQSFQACLSLSLSHCPDFYHTQRFCRFAKANPTYGLDPISTLLSLTCSAKENRHIYMVLHILQMIFTYQSFASWPCSLKEQLSPPVFISVPRHWLTNTWQSDSWSYTWPKLLFFAIILSLIHIVHINL